MDVEEQVAAILRREDAVGYGEWGTDGNLRRWEVQGFGMLRTYLPDDVRLQIWDPRLAVWGNNAVHDHPWDFSSTIIAGTIFNERFRFTESDEDVLVAKHYLARRIKPGIGGGRLDQDPSDVLLMSKGIEVYGPGETYSQRAAELHVTRYALSTITLLRRTGRLERDEAMSLWPAEQEAESIFYEPRPATKNEVHAVCSRALSLHFSLL